MCKMTALGSYYHDFPRLAQQSGYFFQLYRGKVNWNEIETLNLEEIVENRNFQLLEHHLVNVINCNLEREYDLKILDQKFVKLFKLAQLGVDYLSYCETYLDRCVVLLQEQLVALREDYESLKKEVQKKNEELKKIKKKSKSDNYQCKQCEKIFISEVYLNHHEKRRHSVPNTPKSLDRSPNKGIDFSQQTDHGRKITSSTQTITSEEKKISNEIENINEIKKENNEKIENLQKELEDLKNRLKKTENTLTEKVEAADTGHQPFLNYPGPVFYPSILPYVPSYLTQPSSFYDINLHPQIIADVRQSVPSTVTESTGIDVNHGRLISSEENLEQKSTDRSLKAREETKCIAPQVEKSFGEEVNKNLQFVDTDNEKENINPQVQTVFSSSETIKPRPFPRRRKKLFQHPIEKEQTLIESFVQKPNVTKLVNSDSGIFNTQCITLSSTPVKQTKENEEKEEINNTPESKFSQKEIVSNESTNSKEISLVESKKRFSIKKFVPKSSQGLPNFSKSLKLSLTNLYDSVSSTSKDSSRVKESKKVLDNPVEMLNNELKELGVDPEWTGIPKKTLKQKLKALRYRRKHLAEENPIYPAVRQNIKKNIFKRLRSHSNKKEIFDETVNESNPNEPQSPRISSADLEETKHSVVVHKPVMYNVETDSETESSDLEPLNNVNQKREIPLKTAFESSESEVEENVKPEKIESEFDLSIFQVKKGSENIVEKTEEKKKEAELFVDEFQTDSDFDTDFLDDLEEAQRKLVAEADKNGEEKGNIPQAFGIGKELENQSILKSTPSSTQLMSKKKVLFVDYENNSQKQPKECDNDLWSLKSD